MLKDLSDELKDLTYTDDLLQYPGKCKDTTDKLILSFKTTEKATIDISVSINNL